MFSRKICVSNLVKIVFETEASHGIPCPMEVHEYPFCVAHCS